MRSLLRLHDQSSRLVIGLMSGSSLDGIDAVLAKIEGTGPSLEIEPVQFHHEPYPDALRGLLRSAATNAASPRTIARLQTRLAGMYALAAECALVEARRTYDALDLIGCHGQTIQHLPEPAECAGESVRATLQLGNPSMLATRLGIPVVGDFRSADLAMGGQGAPLVPYFDYAFFTDSDEPRALLNLGGIANLTVLPAAASTDEVRAFDTGPANMVIDALADRLFDAPMDRGGQFAAQGTADHDLLADLLEGDYFHREPPKSTGRSQFGPDFVDHVLGAAQAQGLDASDTIATATLLTAASVYQAYARFIRAEQPIERVIVSGGGVHNDTLMTMLEEAFAPIPVESIAEHRVNPDAKEALCMAVLAHETVNGVPTNLPSVTGAARQLCLGSISVPD